MDSSLQDVALSDITETVGSPPSPRVLKSIQTMGVVQPVLLAERVDEQGVMHYVIIDGNRRVHASREAGFENIPALVIQNLTDDHIAQLTLIANGFRTANYLTEFWAIEHLGRNQFSKIEIQDVSGFANSTLGHRAGLSSLNRELFIALRNGELSQQNASTIAKFPQEDQEMLAERFRRFGQLRKTDIDEVRSRLTESDMSIDDPETPARYDQLHEHLALAVQSALVMGLGKQDFLTLATQAWDMAPEPPTQTRG